MNFFIAPASLLQLLLLILLVSLPDVSHGWSFGLRSYPNSNGLSSPWQGWTPTPAQIQKKRQSALLDRFTITKRSNNKLSSPPFEIMDTENEFQVSIDVPGVKRGDIHVDLLHDGATLSISGRREHKQKGGGEVSTFKFSKHFSLDPAVRVDKLKANLQNGVLTVSAPKVNKKRIGKIPVQVTGDEEVSTNNPKEDEANTTVGGEASFDARHGAADNYRRHDPMEEEENDTNAA